jgi:hypothetical protein
MGGPIKEGIMQGMQDGGLANNEGPRRAALVGNSVFPRTGGRENHLIQIPIGLGLNALRIGAMRALPKVTGFFRSRPFIEGGGKGIAGKYQPAPLTTTEKIKQFFQTAPAGKVIAGDPLVKAAFGSGKIASKVVKPAAKFAFGTPSGLLLTGYGASKMLGGDELPETTEETPKLERTDKIGTGEGTTGGSITDDPDKAKQIQEDRIAKTKKRYYELMGIDKMKKDAAYDSLLDASNIVLEEGADLKGAIKSGTLQNRIINAISKNLDKSADIKRQIDAAIVKSEIEKDINKDKYASEKLLREKQLKVLDKQLKGPDLNDTLSELRKQGIVPEGSELASLALRNDIVIPKGHVLNTKDVNTFLKDNPTLTVVDFLNDQNLKLQQAGKGGLTPGKYVVGKNILEVGDNGTVVDVII